MTNAKQSDQSGASKKAKDLGAYIVIGFISGALIGLLMGNLTLWTGIGMCLGIVLGAMAGNRTNPNQE